ncbi:MAG: DUF1573 domain-containing protein [Planctomycetes bacterium]|nr:DUF1573 domain-containing protein [Planctomycetota bacterium]
MQRMYKLIVIAAISTSILGCGNSEVEETAPKTEVTMDIPEGSPSNGANITFAFDEYDFGTIWDDKPVDCVFPFMNHGNQTLIISRMKAGCGCTTPVADKTILQPGEESLIRVQFNPKGKSKKQDKKVTIFSNASVEPEKTFWIRSYVQPIVDVNPKFVQLGEMTMGQETTKTFTFTPAPDDFVVTKMEGTGKHGQYISGEVLDTPVGQPKEIQITVSRDMPWGAFHSQLQVTGTGTMPDGTPMTHTFSVFANGKTFGKLRANDFIARLGSLVSGGAYHKRIRIFRSDGEMFTVTNTTIISPNPPSMNATAVQVPSPEGMAYEIVVSGTLPANFTGQVSGELLVQTDVPGEEVLRFRITGVVPKRQ